MLPFENFLYQSTSLSKSSLVNSGVGKASNCCRTSSTLSVYLSLGLPLSSEHSAPASLLQVSPTPCWLPLVKAQPHKTKIASHVPI